jgi:ribonuclease P protein component
VHPSGARTRVGLIVPRFRQSAVARNRVKRRLRELSRTRILPTDLAADVVIRIRPEAYRAPFALLASDVDRVIMQLQQWRAGEAEPRSTPLDARGGDPANDT